jgi:predicted unusual protein kinase regulating ubiquinone biosynthesis (AarF/ABC1/UbiB family)
VAVLSDRPGDVPAAFRELGFETRDSDPTPLLLLGRAFLGITVPGRPYVDLERLVEVNAQLARAVRANPLMELPQEFVFIMRVLGLLSGLGKRLDSRVNLATTMLPFAETALRTAPR